MIQERFDEMIALLRRYMASSPVIIDLLEISHSSVLTFSYPRKPSASSRKQSVIDAFEIRTIIKQSLENEHPTTPALLEQLKQTNHDHICVSIFRTGRGVFNIFTDFDRTDLIGIMYFSEELDTPPLYSHLFMNGYLLSRER
ncbi:MAG: hypothetical protein JST68_00580 [Bacteroidetes bacterium]|nr:hypothetical protein [Bacteroidota bacterium]